MSRDEDILRRVLAAEASAVDVEARALAEIRQKVANRRPRRWRPIVGLVVATSAAAVLVGALVSVPSHRTPRPPADSAGPTASAPPQANLPVYYVGRSDLLPQAVLADVGVDARQQPGLLQIGGLDQVRE